MVFEMSVQLTLSVDLCHLLIFPCWPDRVSSACPPEQIELFAANIVPALVGLTDRKTLEVARPVHEVGLV